MRPVRRSCGSLGGSTLLLPTVQKAGFTTLAVVLALMLIVSGIIGILFAPTPEERDIERTERFRRPARELGISPGAKLERRT